MKETATHIFFWGGGIFTNFYTFNHTYKGFQVHSSEQSFMLEKAWEFDPEMVPEILATNKPEQAKRLGRKIKNYDEEVWAAIRYQKMVDVLIVKFAQPSLNKQLLATGSKILVEASPYDRIWGVGLKKEDPRIEQSKNWLGQNLLGKALMEVRSYYQQQT